MHLDCSGIGDGNRIGRIARIEEARVPVARVLLQDAGTGRGRLAAGMSCTVKAGLVWIGWIVCRSTAERGRKIWLVGLLQCPEDRGPGTILADGMGPIGPSPGSIFPGCFVHALRPDLVDCAWIAWGLRIVLDFFIVFRDMLSVLNLGCCRNADWPTFATGS